MLFGILWTTCFSTVMATTQQMTIPAPEIAKMEGVCNQQLMDPIRVRLFFKVLLSKQHLF